MLFKIIEPLLDYASLEYIHLKFEKVFASQKREIGSCLNRKKYTDRKIRQDGWTDGLIDSTQKITL